jgi:small subunit ribosomal protein S16
MGAKKKPFYRLVVADARSPRDGRFIEAVGVYDPLANPALVRLDADRIKDWISKGARPTDVARQLLVSEGVLERTGPVYDPSAAKPKASKKAQAKAAAAAAAPAQAPAAPPEVASTERVAAEPAASEDKTTSSDAVPTAPASETEPEPPAPVEQPAEAPAVGEAEAIEASE